MITMSSYTWTDERVHHVCCTSCMLITSCTPAHLKICQYTWQVFILTWHPEYISSLSWMCTSSSNPVDSLPVHMYQFIERRIKWSEIQMYKYNHLCLRIDYIHYVFLVVDVSGSLVIYILLDWLTAALHVLTSEHVWGYDESVLEAVVCMWLLYWHCTCTCHTGVEGKTQGTGDQWFCWRYLHLIYLWVRASVWFALSLTCYKMFSFKNSCLNPLPESVWMFTSIFSVFLVCFITFVWFAVSLTCYKMFSGVDLCVNLLAESA